MESKSVFLLHYSTIQAAEKDFIIQVEFSRSKERNQLPNKGLQQLMQYSQQIEGEISLQLLSYSAWQNVGMKFCDAEK